MSEPLGSLPNPYGSQQAPPKITVSNNAAVSKTVSNPTPNGSPGGDNARQRTRSNSLTDSAPIHKMNSLDNSMPPRGAPPAYDSAPNRTVSEAERGMGMGMGIHGAPSGPGFSPVGAAPLAPPQQQLNVNRTVSEAERGGLAAGATSPPSLMATGGPPVGLMGQSQPPTMAAIYPGPRLSVTIPQVQTPDKGGGPPLPSGIRRDSSKESPGGSGGSLPASAGPPMGAGAGPPVSAATALTSAGPPPTGGPSPAHSNFYNAHVAGPRSHGMFRPQQPAHAAGPAPSVGVFPSMPQGGVQVQGRSQQQTPLSASHSATPGAGTGNAKAGRRPSNPSVEHSPAHPNPNPNPAFGTPVVGGAPGGNASISANLSASRRPSLGHGNAALGGFVVGDAVHTNAISATGAAIPEIVDMESEKEVSAVRRSVSPSPRGGSRGWVEFILQCMNAFLSALISVTLVIVVVLFVLLYGHLVAPLLAPLLLACAGCYQSVLQHAVQALGGVGSRPSVDVSLLLEHDL